MKNREGGFSLVEVLVAVGILGGAVLCILGIFTPVFLKTKSIEKLHNIRDIEARIDAYIQSSSFNEIFLITQTSQYLYFYENKSEKEEIRTELRVEGEGDDEVFKVLLGFGERVNFGSLEPEEYEKSYFPIYVEIFDIRDVEKKLRSFITVKNR